MKAHLVPKQTLKREFPQGAVFVREMGADAPSWLPYDPRMSFMIQYDIPGGGFKAVGPVNETAEASGPPRRDQKEIVWDPRCWRWMCGGPTGLGGHHGQYDAKQIRIPPEQVPPDLLAYLAEYDLEWMIEAYV